MGRVCPARQALGKDTKRALTKFPAILVTGASSGIGAHCARALKRDGWRVLATARKDADIAALAADGIEAFRLDYADPPSIAALVDDVLEATGGRLDALFNNGAHALPGAVEDLPVDALRHQFEVNVFGWHDLTRRVVPVMRAQGHGRLVHCSSILGIVPVKWRGAYVASKHALEGLMLSMRAELQGSGIHVSLIEPGPIRSRFAENAAAHFRAEIDMEGSVHRAAYAERLARLEAGGTQSSAKLGPEAVYAALRHALEHRRPRPHYPVTTPARAGMLLRRLLPASLFYRFVSSRA